MKEMSNGFNFFLGLIYFLHLLINIGSIGQVVYWAEEDPDNVAMIFAIVACALFWTSTIIASCYWCKKTPQRLASFLPVFFFLWVFSLIDLIGYESKAWERSIYMSNTERRWIVTGNMVNIVASSYNFSFAAQMSGMM